MKALFALLPALLLSGCTYTTRDTLDTDDVGDRSWTVARRVVEARHILAECSSGTGEDTLTLKLDRPEPGKAYLLPSDAAAGSASWCFRPDDTAHQEIHALRGSVRVVAVTPQLLEVDLEAEAVHPESDRACRSIRRRIDFRPGKR